MIKVSCLDKTGYVHIDDFHNLHEALTEIRNCWNEGEGPQCFIFQNDYDKILATMLRHISESELAITTYGDGRKVIHSCKYISNNQGKYKRTEIKQIS